MPDNLLTFDFESLDALIAQLKILEQTIQGFIKVQTTKAGSKDLDINILKKGVADAITQAMDKVLKATGGKSSTGVDINKVLREMSNVAKSVGKATSVEKFDKSVVYLEQVINKLTTRSASTLGAKAGVPVELSSESKKVVGILSTLAENMKKVSGLVEQSGFSLTERIKKLGLNIEGIEGGEKNAQKFKQFLNKLNTFTETYTAHASELEKLSKGGAGSFTKVAASVQGLIGLTSNIGDAFKNVPKQVKGIEKISGFDQIVKDVQLMVRTISEQLTGALKGVGQAAPLSNDLKAVAKSVDTVLNGIQKGIKAKLDKVKDVKLKVTDTGTEDVISKQLEKRADRVGKAIKKSEESLQKRMSNIIGAKAQKYIDAMVDASTYESKLDPKALDETIRKFSQRKKVVKDFNTAQADEVNAMNAYLAKGAELNRATEVLKQISNKTKALGKERKRFADPSKAIKTYDQDIKKLSNLRVEVANQLSELNRRDMVSQMVRTRLNKEIGDVERTRNQLEELTLEYKGFTASEKRSKTGKGVKSEIDRLKSGVKRWEKTAEESQKELGKLTGKPEAETLISTVVRMNVAERLKKNILERATSRFHAAREGSSEKAERKGEVAKLKEGLDKLRKARVEASKGLDRIMGVGPTKAAIPALERRVEEVRTLLTDPKLVKSYVGYEVKRWSEKRDRLQKQKKVLEERMKSSQTVDEKDTKNLELINKQLEITVQRLGTAEVSRELREEGMTDDRLLRFIKHYSNRVTSALSTYYDLRKSVQQRMRTIQKEVNVTKEKRGVADPAQFVKLSAVDMGQLEASDKPMKFEFKGNLVESLGFIKSKLVKLSAEATDKIGFAIAEEMVKGTPITRLIMQFKESGEKLAKEIPGALKGVAGKGTSAGLIESQLRRMSENLTTRASKEMAFSMTPTGTKGAPGGVTGRNIEAEAERIFTQMMSPVVGFEMVKFPMGAQSFAQKQDPSAAALPSLDSIMREQGMEEKARNIYSRTFMKLLSRGMDWQKMSNLLGKALGTAIPEQVEQWSLRMAADAKQFFDKSKMARDISPTVRQAVASFKAGENTAILDAMTSVRAETNAFLATLYERIAKAANEGDTSSMINYFEALKTYRKSMQSRLEKKLVDMARKKKGGKLTDVAGGKGFVPLDKGARGDLLVAEMEKINQQDFMFQKQIQSLLQYSVRGYSQQPPDAPHKWTPARPEYIPRLLKGSEKKSFGFDPKAHMVSSESVIKDMGSAVQFKDKEGMQKLKGRFVELTKEQAAQFKIITENFKQYFENDHKFTERAYEFIAETVGGKTKEKWTDLKDVKSGKKLGEVGTSELELLKTLHTKKGAPTAKFQSAIRNLFLKIVEESTSSQGNMDLMKRLIIDREKSAENRNLLMTAAERAAAEFERFPTKLLGTKELYDRATGQSKIAREKSVSLREALSEFGKQGFPLASIIKMARAVGDTATDYNKQITSIRDSVIKATKDGKVPAEVAGLPVFRAKAAFTAIPEIQKSIEMLEKQGETKGTSKKLKELHARLRKNQEGMRSILTSMIKQYVLSGSNEEIYRKIGLIQTDAPDSDANIAKLTGEFLGLDKIKYSQLSKKSKDEQLRAITDILRPRIKREFEEANKVGAQLDEAMQESMIQMFSSQFAIGDKGALSNVFGSLFGEFKAAGYSRVPGKEYSQRGLFTAGRGIGVGTSGPAFTPEDVEASRYLAETGRGIVTPQVMEGAGAAAATLKKQMEAAAGTIGLTDEGFKQLNKETNGMLATMKMATPSVASNFAGGVAGQYAGESVFKQLARTMDPNLRFEMGPAAKQGTDIHGIVERMYQDIAAAQGLKSPMVEQRITGTGKTAFMGTGIADVLRDTGAGRELIDIKTGGVPWEEWIKKHLPDIKSQLARYVALMKSLAESNPEIAKYIGDFDKLKVGVQYIDRGALKKALKGAGIKFKEFSELQGMMNDPALRGTIQKVVEKVSTIKYVGGKELGQLPNLQELYIENAQFAAMFSKFSEQGTKFRSEILPKLQEAAAKNKGKVPAGEVQKLLGQFITSTSINVNELVNFQDLFGQAGKRIQEQLSKAPKAPRGTTAPGGVTAAEGPIVQQFISGMGKEEVAAIGDFSKKLNSVTEKIQKKNELLNQEVQILQSEAAIFVVIGKALADMNRFLRGTATLGRAIKGIGKVMEVFHIPEAEIAKGLGKVTQDLQKFDKLKDEISNKERDRALKEAATYMSSGKWEAPGKSAMAPEGVQGVTEELKQQEVTLKDLSTRVNEYYRDFGRITKAAKDSNVPLHERVQYLREAIVAQKDWALTLETMRPVVAPVRYAAEQSRYATRGTEVQGALDQLKTDYSQQGLSPVDKEVNNIRQQIIQGQENAVKNAQAIVQLNKEAGRPLMDQWTYNEKIVDSQGKQIAFLDVMINKQGKVTTELKRGVSVYSGPLTMQMKNIMARLAKWGAGAYLYFGIMRGARQAVQSMIELEENVTKLRQVMNEATTDFGQMTGQAFDLAAAYATPIQELFKTMQEFARQGLSQQEVVEATRVATIAANVTVLNATKAMDVLTAATRQYNISAMDSIKVLDAWNLVANRNAVTASDLGDAMKQSGSIAKLIGLDFNELTGMLSSLQETTRRGGPTIGRAMRFMLTHLRTEETEQALNSLGITIRKTAGEYRSASAVFKEIAERWNDMTSAQKYQVAQAIGQVRFGAFVAAMFENWHKVVKATTEATYSHGSAMSENAVAMESFKKQIAALKNEWTALVTSFGKSGILGFFKLVVRGGRFVLDVFNEMPSAIKSVVGGVTTAAIAFMGLSRILSWYFRVDLSAVIQKFGMGKKITAALGAEGKARTVNVGVIESEVTATGKLMAAQGTVVKEVNAETLARKANLAVMGQQLKMMQTMTASTAAQRAGYAGTLLPSVHIKDPATGQFYKSAAGAGFSMKQGATQTAAQIAAMKTAGTMATKTVAEQTAKTTMGAFVKQSAAAGSVSGKAFAGKFSAALTGFSAAKMGGVGKGLLGGLMKGLGAVGGFVATPIGAAIAAVGVGLIGLKAAYEVVGRKSEKVLKENAEQFAKLQKRINEAKIAMESYSAVMERSQKDVDKFGISIAQLKEGSKFRAELATAFPESELIEGFDRYGRAILNTGANLEEFRKTMMKLANDKSAEVIRMQMEDVSHLIGQLSDPGQFRKGGMFGWAFGKLAGDSAIENIKDARQEYDSLRKRYDSIAKEVRAGTMEEITGIRKQEKLVKSLKDSSQELQKYASVIEKQMIEIQKRFSNISKTGAGGIASAMSDMLSPLGKQNLAFIIDMYVQEYGREDITKGFKAFFVNTFGDLGDFLATPFAYIPEDKLRASAGAFGKAIDTGLNEATGMIDPALRKAADDLRRAVDTGIYQKELKNLFNELYKLDPDSSQFEAVSKRIEEDMGTFAFVISKKVNENGEIFKRTIIPTIEGAYSIDEETLKDFDIDVSKLTQSTFVEQMPKIIAELKKRGEKGKSLAAALREVAGGEDVDKLGVFKFDVKIDSTYTDTFKKAVDSAKVYRDHLTTIQKTLDTIGSKEKSRLAGLKESFIGGSKSFEDFEMVLSNLGTKIRKEFLLYSGFIEGSVSLKPMIAEATLLQSEVELINNEYKQRQSLINRLISQPSVFLEDKRAVQDLRNLTRDIPGAEDLFNVGATSVTAGRDRLIAQLKDVYSGIRKAVEKERPLTSIEEAFTPDVSKIQLHRGLITEESVTSFKKQVLAEFNRKGRVTEEFVLDIPLRLKPELAGRFEEVVDWTKPVYGPEGNVAPEQFQPRIRREIPKDISEFEKWQVDQIRSTLVTETIDKYANMQGRQLVDGWARGIFEGTSTALKGYNFGALLSKTVKVNDLARQMANVGQRIFDQAANQTRGPAALEGMLGLSTLNVAEALRASNLGGLAINASQLIWDELGMQLEKADTTEMKQTIAAKFVEGISGLRGARTAGEIAKAIGEGDLLGRGKEGFLQLLVGLKLSPKDVRLFQSQMSSIMKDAKKLAADTGEGYEAVAGAISKEREKVMKEAREAMKDSLELTMMYEKRRDQSISDVKEYVTGMISQLKGATTGAEVPFEKFSSAMEDKVNFIDGVLGKLSVSSDEKMRTFAKNLRGSLKEIVAAAVTGFNVDAIKKAIESVNKAMAVDIYELGPGKYFDTIISQFKNLGVAFEETALNFKVAGGKVPKSFGELYDALYGGGVTDTDIKKAKEAITNARKLNAENRKARTETVSSISSIKEKIADYQKKIEEIKKETVISEGSLKGLKIAFTPDQLKKVNSYADSINKLEKSMDGLTEKQTKLNEEIAKNEKIEIEKRVIASAKGTKEAEEYIGKLEKRFLQLISTLGLSSKELKYFEGKLKGMEVSDVLPKVIPILEARNAQKKMNEEIERFVKLAGAYQRYGMTERYMDLSKVLSAVESRIETLRNVWLKTGSDIDEQKLFNVERIRDQVSNLRGLIDANRELGKGLNLLSAQVDVYRSSLDSVGKTADYFKSAIDRIIEASTEGGSKMWKDVSPSIRSAVYGMEAYYSELLGIQRAQEQIGKQVDAIGDAWIDALSGDDKGGSLAASFKQLKRQADRDFIQPVLDDWKKLFVSKVETNTIKSNIEQAYRNVLEEMEYLNQHSNDKQSDIHNAFILQLRKAFGDFTNSLENIFYKSKIKDLLFGPPSIAPVTLPPYMPGLRAPGAAGFGASGMVVDGSEGGVLGHQVAKYGSISATLHPGEVVVPAHLAGAIPSHVINRLPVYDGTSRIFAAGGASINDTKNKTSSLLTDAGIDSFRRVLTQSLSAAGIPAAQKALLDQIKHASTVAGVSMGDAAYLLDLKKMLTTNPLAFSDWDNTLFFNLNRNKIAQTLVQDENLFKTIAGFFRGSGDTKFADEMLDALKNGDVFGAAKKVVSSDKLLGVRKGADGYQELVKLIKDNYDLHPLGKLIKGDPNFKNVLTMAGVSPDLSADLLETSKLNVYRQGFSQTGKASPHTREVVRIKGALTDSKAIEVANVQETFTKAVEYLVDDLEDQLKGVSIDDLENLSLKSLFNKYDDLEMSLNHYLSKNVFLPDRPVVMRGGSKFVGTDDLTGLKFDVLTSRYKKHLKGLEEQVLGKPFRTTLTQFDPTAIESTASARLKTPGAIPALEEAKDTVKKAFGLMDDFDPKLGRMGFKGSSMFKASLGPIASGLITAAVGGGEDFRKKTGLGSFAEKSILGGLGVTGDVVGTAGGALLAKSIGYSAFGPVGLISGIVLDVIITTLVTELIKGIMQSPDHKIADKISKEVFGSQSRLQYLRSGQHIYSQYLRYLKNEDGSYSDLAFKMLEREGRSLTGLANREGDTLSGHASSIQSLREGYPEAHIKSIKERFKKKLDDTAYFDLAKQLGVTPRDTLTDLEAQSLSGKTGTGFGPGISVVGGQNVALTPIHTSRTFPHVDELLQKYYDLGYTDMHLYNRILDVADQLALKAGYIFQNPVKDALPELSGQISRIAEVYGKGNPISKAFRPMLSMASGGQIGEGGQLGHAVAQAGEVPAILHPGEVVVPAHMAGGVPINILNKLPVYDGFSKRAASGLRLQAGGAIGASTEEDIKKMRNLGVEIYLLEESLKSIPWDEFSREIRRNVRQLRDKRALDSLDIKVSSESIKKTKEALSMLDKQGGVTVKDIEEAGGTKRLGEGSVERFNEQKKKVEELLQAHTHLVTSFKTAEDVLKSYSDLPEKDSRKERKALESELGSDLYGMAKKGSHLEERIKKEESEKEPDTKKIKRFEERLDAVNKEMDEYLKNQRSLNARVGKWDSAVIASTKVQEVNSKKIGNVFKAMGEGILAGASGMPQMLTKFRITMGMERDPAVERVKRATQVKSDELIGKEAVSIFKDLKDKAAGTGKAGPTITPSALVAMFNKAVESVRERTGGDYGEEDIGSEMAMQLQLMGQYSESNADAVKRLTDSLSDLRVQARKAAQEVVASEKEKEKELRKLRMKKTAVEAFENMAQTALVSVGQAASALVSDVISSGLKLAPVGAKLRGTEEGKYYMLGAKQSEEVEERKAAGAAAGGMAGAAIGKAVGSYWGPVGAAIGSAVGQKAGEAVGGLLGPALGEIFDFRDKTAEEEERTTQNALKSAMAFSTALSTLTSVMSQASKEVEASFNEMIGSMKGSVANFGKDLENGILYINNYANEFIGAFGEVDGEELFNQMFGDVDAQESMNSLMDSLADMSAEGFRSAAAAVSESGGMVAYKTGEGETVEFLDTLKNVTDVLRTTIGSIFESSKTDIVMEEFGSAIAGAGGDALVLGQTLMEAAASSRAAVQIFTEAAGGGQKLNYDQLLKPFWAASSAFAAQAVNLDKMGKAQEAVSELSLDAADAAAERDTRQDRKFLYFRWKSSSQDAQKQAQQSMDILNAQKAAADSALQAAQIDQQIIELKQKIAEKTQEAVDTLDQYASNINKMMTKGQDMKKAWSMIGNMFADMGAGTIGSEFDNLASLFRDLNGATADLSGLISGEASDAFSNFTLLSQEGSDRAKTFLTSTSAEGRAAIDTMLGGDTSQGLALSSDQVFSAIGQVIALSGDQVSAIASVSQEVAGLVASMSTEEIYIEYKKFLAEEAKKSSAHQQTMVSMMTDVLVVGMTDMIYTTDKHLKAMEDTMSLWAAKNDLLKAGISEAVDQFARSVEYINAPDYAQQVVAAASGGNMEDVFDTYGSMSKDIMALFGENTRGQLEISHSAKEFYGKQIELASQALVVYQATLRSQGAAQRSNIEGLSGLRQDVVDAINSDTALTAEQLRYLQQEVAYQIGGDEGRALQAKIIDVNEAIAQASIDTAQKQNELVNLGKESNDLLMKQIDAFQKEMGQPDVERRFVQMNLEFLRNTQHAINRVTGGVFTTEGGEVNKVSESEWMQLQAVGEGQLQVAKTLEEFEKMYGEKITQGPKDVSTYSTVRPITNNIDINIDADFIDPSQLDADRQRELALMVRDAIVEEGFRFSST